MILFHVRRSISDLVALSDVSWDRAVGCVSLHSFRGGNPNRRNIGRVLDRRRWGWLWSIGRLAVGSGGDWVGIGAWTVYLMLG